MISIFRTVGAKAEDCTLQKFAEIIDSQRVKDLVTAFRNGDADAKRRLPAVTWQAHFSEGETRSNKNARPTGLFMLDVDHIDTDNEVARIFTSEGIDIPSLGIKIVHVTPSGRGLRFVALMPKFAKNIAEAQKWLASKLGFDTYDEATHDLARLSFLTRREDFLLIDQSIFTNEFNTNNNETENKSLDTDNNSCTESAEADNGCGEASEKTRGECEQHSTADSNVTTGGAGQGKQECEKIDGVALSDIIEAVVESQGGVPQEGMRNTRLYQLARVMRYVMDFSPEKMFLRLPHWGLPDDEVRSVMESACKGGRASQLPKTLYFAIKGLKQTAEDVKDSDSDILVPEEEELPPLPPVFSDFVGIAPNGFKGASVVALLPVMGTIVSKVRAQYLDGELHSPSFQVVIEAPQASGKSFTRRIVDTCLQGIKERDIKERLVEAQYNQQIKKLKNAKNQPEEPQTIIRLLPASVSTAKLLKRLDSAQGLHLFSFCEEIDTLTKSNSSGAWAQKSDIYRNAFDNAEYGQDYMSDSSYSAVCKVYYNLLLCGTPRAVSRFYKDPEDGLVSRVLFELLPDQFGMSMPEWGRLKKKQLENIDQTIRSLTEEYSYTADLVSPEQEISIAWVNRAMKRWLEEKRQQSVTSMSRATDIFRRRAAVVGFRAGMIAFLLWNTVKKLPHAQMRKNTADFACWVADRMLRSLVDKYDVQMQRIEDSNSERPKNNSSVFDELPAHFSTNDVAVLLRKNFIRSAPKQVIYLWRKEGLIIKKDWNEYEKVNTKD